MRVRLKTSSYYHSQRAYEFVLYDARIPLGEDLVIRNTAHLEMRCLRNWEWITSLEVWSAIKDGDQN